MHLHISKSHEDGKGIKLYISSKSMNIINRYSRENDIDFNSSVEELIAKGYEYHKMESYYKKNIRDREVWDKRFYFLTVESRYLYYKLKVRELYEELKTQTLQLSSILSQLEYCYQRYMKNNENAREELEKIREMRKSLDKYADKYLLINRKSSSQDEYIDDDEVISSIKETLARYIEIMRKEHDHQKK